MFPISVKKYVKSDINNVQFLATLGKGCIAAQELSI